MTNPGGTEGGAGRGKERLPEAELGGADAVEKTTYVVGDGTDPEARPSGPYIARGAATSGPSVTLWVVGTVAALIALVYVIGIFR
jgi:hypothetical protein